MEQDNFNTGKGVLCGNSSEGHVPVVNERDVGLAMQIIELWQAQQQGSEQSLANQCQDFTYNPSNMQHDGLAAPTSPHPPQPTSPVQGSFPSVYGNKLRSVGSSLRGIGGRIGFSGRLPVGESGRRQQQTEILRSYTEAQQQAWNRYGYCDVSMNSSSESNVPYVEPVVEPTFGVVRSPVRQHEQSELEQQQQPDLIDLLTPVPIGEGAGGIGHGPSIQPREVKLERPSTFSGKHSELDNFVFEMQQYLESTGLGSGPRACRFFVTYLKGDAKTWWRTYALSKSRSGSNVFDNLDVDTLVEELSTQFSDVDKLMHVRDKLFRLRQTDKVSHYTSVFRRLLVELGSEQLDDETAKYLYTRGLKYEVQNQVLLHRPDTFEDMVYCAERAGQAIELAKSNFSNNSFGGNRGGRNFNNRGGRFGGYSGGRFGGYPNNRGGGFGGNQGRNMSNQGRFGGNSGRFGGSRGGLTQFGDHPYKGSGPMDLGALQKQLLAMQSNQQKPKSSAVCWYCGKQGHVKSQCFKMQRDQQGSSSSGDAVQQGNVAQQLAHILSNMQTQQQGGSQQQQQDKGKGPQQPKN